MTSLIPIGLDIAIKAIDVEVARIDAELVRLKGKRDGLVEALRHIEAVIRQEDTVLAAITKADTP